MAQNRKKIKIDKDKVTKRVIQDGYEVVDDNSLHVEINGTVYLVCLRDTDFEDKNGKKYKNIQDIIQDIR